MSSDSSFHSLSSDEDGNEIESVCKEVSFSLAIYFFIYTEFYQ